MYRQVILGYPVSIEQETENVPNDGRYYVLKEGQMVGRFVSLKKAQEKYKEILQELGYKPPK